MALNETEQRNELYIPGAPCDKILYLTFLTKKLKRTQKWKKLFNINLH